MRSLALEPARDLAAQTRAAPPPAAVLVQRHSTFGPSTSVTAPPILDSGRALDPGAQSAMESGFGRDFSNIRVHDDARAHDNARNLGASAYAAGDHIIFGEGRYRPETASGRALIAHELAHSVQQSGVQMKADGPLPAAADAELEAQADRAALAVTGGRSAPALSSIGRPAVFRQDGDAPAAPGASSPAAPIAKSPAAAGSGSDLPGGPTVLEEIPQGPGATRLAIELPLLELPMPKGPGGWVEQAYKAAAKGKSLIFQPVFKGKKISGAIKEKSGESYKDIWLNNYGFTSLKELGDAMAASQDPDVQARVKQSDVKAIVTAFQKDSLLGAKCDIDHIVEKQLGGGSISSNLQLLVASKNRTAGQKTYDYVVSEAEKIAAARTRLTSLSIRFADAKVQPDGPDPSFEIETLLRGKKVQGSAEVRKAGEGTLVALLAGGKQQVTRVRAGGSTPIEDGARRLISGLKLLNYVRKPAAGKGKGEDTVEAEIASKPLIPGVTDKNRAIVLNAAPSTAPAGDDGAAGAAAADRAAIATKDAVGQTAGEYRALTLDRDKNKDVAFYFPYLSPGRFTSLTLDASGGISGTGVIIPSVRFLGELKVNMSPDKLDLVQNIDTNAINSSAAMKPLASMFRFTSGSVSIDLVKFKPDGKLAFEVGPKSKPVILGNINATEEGGDFVATGTLAPADKVPGVSAAKGEVSYRSGAGWSGLLTATTSSFHGAQINVTLGFKEEKGAFTAFGDGSISTQIKNSELKLNVGWRGGAVRYWGGTTIREPLPLVDRVSLKGGYEDEMLTLEGDAAVKWRSIDSTMQITYRRKDGQEGKFSGKADVDIKVNNANGKLSLNFDEAGNYWGKGTIIYPVTKNIKPTLGLELTKDRKVKALGEVAVDDIELTKKWPTPEGGTLAFIKNVGLKFTIPTAIPAVTVFGRLTASAGLRYGVGPVMMTGLKFNGELYPLEDDPQIKAHLGGKLEVPAYGAIYGIFGARIGAEVALGLVSAEGGVDVTPELGVKGKGGITIDADYTAGAFSFNAEAFAEGQMIATLGVSLVAKLSGAWGLISYSWNYPGWSTTKPIGPVLKLTLGKFAYGKGGEITWPSISQIKVEPEKIDPIDIIRDLVSSRRAAED